MITESVLSSLALYFVAGWCTAELHRYSGFFSRYRRIEYCISWIVMFLCWPLLLPLYVSYIGTRSQKENNDG